MKSVFYSCKNEYYQIFITKGKYILINLFPNIEYFIADRFAFESKSTVSSIRGEFSVAEGNSLGGANSKRYLFGTNGRNSFLKKLNPSIH